MFNNYLQNDLIFQPRMTLSQDNFFKQITKDLKYNKSGHWLRSREMDIFKMAVSLAIFIRSLNLSLSINLPVYFLFLKSCDIFPILCQQCIKID